MSSERSLVVHLHELLSYLNAHHVTTIIVSTQHGLINVDQASFEATYLADLVIMLRYFEALGVVRQAISVIKNRGEEHERTLREFQIGEKGIRIGAPLKQFQGVLTGVPTFAGKASSLIREKDGIRKNKRKSS
jgi:circadian clock protein KaiC